MVELKLKKEKYGKKYNCTKREYQAYDYASQLKTKIFWRMSISIIILFVIILLALPDIWYFLQSIFVHKTEPTPTDLLDLIKPFFQILIIIFLYGIWKIACQVQKKTEKMADEYARI